MSAAGSDFAPGVKEELEKLAADGIAPATPLPAAAEPSHVIEYLGDNPRKRAVPLEHPLRFDGREFHRIFVRRLSLAQVQRYMDDTAQVAKTDPDRVVRLPLFVDERGDDLPEGLWDAFDDDDVTALQEAGADFLPRRFRPDPAMEANANDGASPGPAVSSAAPSAAPSDGAAPR